MHKCPFCKKELLRHHADFDGYNVNCDNSSCHYKYRALVRQERIIVADYTRWCVDNLYEICSSIIHNESNIRDLKSNTIIEYNFHISTEISTTESIQNIILLN